MSSDPNLRMRILSGVQQKGFVRAASLPELKMKLGLGDVSTTQFARALRSLHYKYREVRVNRPHSLRPHYGPRIYEVSCLLPDGSTTTTKTATLTGAAV